MFVLSIEINMSHFSLLVIGENVKEQLAPFDENLQVPRYVQYTKEQLIERERKDIEDYKNGTYARFLQDPEAYKANGCNQVHIDYLEKDFPKRLTWTDDEVYAEAIRFYEPNEIGPNGEIFSTYNPKSKWDYWRVGGRWVGSLKLKEGVKPIAPLNITWEHSRMLNEIEQLAQQGYTDIARKGEVINLNDITTFAILKDGQWYERGKMHFFGIVSEEKEAEQWQEEFQQLLTSLPDDTLLTIVDCHI